LFFGIFLVSFGHFVSFFQVLVFPANDFIVWVREMR
jgi:hypothetical protein